MNSRPDTRASSIAFHIGPNWFASVMGTGIVAVAAATLPHRPDWLRPAATVVWLLAAVWLVVLTGSFLAQWLRHPESAKAHHRDPVAVQFYGAPPMALLTVGAGTLAFGPQPVAVPVAAVLWTLGTATGLVSAVLVPYLMFTRPGLSGDTPFAGWLMPVVPPMVSAATGAALLPHLPAGQARLTMLLACFAMFGLSLLATVLILPQVWAQLARRKLGEAAAVPAVWITLGPLGQSVTAAGNLGAVVPDAVHGPSARALALFGVVYGVCVYGFALLWMALALCLTVRAVRTSMPFTLTWWSFTFPVGTCVTGASVLAHETGAEAYSWLSVLLYAALVGAWALVAVRMTTTGLRRRRIPAPV